MLIDAWCLEPGDKHWTAIHYTIDHGKFETNFGFDDLEGSDESSDDPRERILRARYGDKPVIHPPLSTDAIELRPTP